MDFPKSVPSVGLVNGKFVDEDTNTATPGSLIPAAWGNAVTGEIINVIEQSGLEPTEGQNDQLFTAISQLITNNLSGQATEEVAGVAKIASDDDFTAAVADDTKMATVQKIKTWFSTVMKQATEAAFGWAKIATQTQTNSGADDTTIVTPKKLSVALAALVTQATEAISGLLKIATQDQVNAGLDDLTAVTPRKLRFGFTASIAANGFVAVPSWLGGWVLQWGTVTVAAFTNVGSFTATFATTFPNNCFGVHLTGMTTVSILSIASKTNSGFTANANTRDSGNAQPQGAAFFVGIGN